MNYANTYIQEMSPYTPPLENRRAYRGELLDFNERTIPAGKKVVRALMDLLNDGKLQVYPEYGDLCEDIASYSGVKKDQVMVTNGSDQGIELIFKVFTEKGDRVIIPTPSFAMFYQCADANENQVIKVSDGDDMLEQIDKDVRLVVICNPNNPTGTLVGVAEIEKILDKALENDAVVFVDEAYYEFSKVTAAGLIDKYPNLIITRTFSKAFGLASLRIGYVLSDEKNISEMLKVRGPYDINMPAVVAAKAALDDLDSLDEYVDEVMNRAKPMVESYFRDNGVEFFPSKANFILLKTDDLNVTGVRTRPRNGMIRLTIGTTEQMKKFINKIKNV